MRRLIVDTGPVVALLDDQEPYHAWASRQLLARRTPMLTCEAVLAEACFLMRRHHGGPQAVVQLLADEFLQVAFDLGSQCDTVERLMARYANVPMSLADACLVRMAELDPQADVLTFDSDFLIYRLHGDQPVPLLMPPAA